MSNNQVEREDDLSSLDEALFILTHPFLSLLAMKRRFTAEEEFAGLSISQTARAIGAARQTRQTGGVSQGAWSEADQELMAEGKLPKGYPEHTNV